MITVILLLALVGFFATIYAALKPAQQILWVPVMLLYIIVLLQILPKG